MLLIWNNKDSILLAMHPQNLRIEDFIYELPDERIAKYPLPERDASKLLIYRGGAIDEDRYTNIAEHIATGSLMVFNQTKVVHARMLFAKATGGVIEVFCLAPHEQYKDIQTAMLQKGEVLWECLVGGAGKWKNGMVLQLHNVDPDFTLSASIVERSQASYILKLAWNDPELTFAEVLHHAGKVPLPPYLHRSAEVGDDERYQTVFAKEEGSVAAPTAGLHFTSGVLESIKANNVDTSFVTLHVGAGTFKPVKSDTMADHEMHAEWLEVTYETILQLIWHIGNDVIAVGTTSLRTLESLYWIGNKIANGIDIDLQSIAVSQWEPYDEGVKVSADTALNAIAGYMKANDLPKIITRTRIIIAPGYSFRIVNGLVTNFHQPASTLLLLVSAFIGNDWRKVYEYGMNNDFRFLSYGDGSLLWHNS